MFKSSSLFTNSNWFTFDGERGINDRLAASVPSSSPNSEEASPDTEETDDGQVIGTEDQMENLSLGNGPSEEAEDAAECAKQTNFSTEDEQLESAEGIERHPDASAGDTEVSTDEAASAVAESSAPATERLAEGTVDKPTGTSDLDNPIPEASPDTDVNGSDLADSAVSSGEAVPNKDVELPVRTDTVVDTVSSGQAVPNKDVELPMKSDAVVDTSSGQAVPNKDVELPVKSDAVVDTETKTDAVVDKKTETETDAVVDEKTETDAIVDVAVKADAVVDLPSREASPVDIEVKTGAVEANE